LLAVQAAQSQGTAPAGIGFAQKFPIELTPKAFANFSLGLARNPGVTYEKN
jgi:hypothetical protein